ncbi:MAG TPA: hypothetical protein VF557_16945 [Jatrophihabitans sp.]|jgi:hypothetical protein|uniref:hypothetical protein n=1 Tax=Jatrophihabitans sp. TaxID=1932789 RepID=UPI002F05B0B4
MRSLSELYRVSRKRHNILRGTLGPDYDDALGSAYIKLCVRGESLLRSETKRVERFVSAMVVLLLMLGFCYFLLSIAMSGSVAASASYFVITLVLMWAFGIMGFRTDSLWVMLSPSAALCGLSGLLLMLVSSKLGDSKISGAQPVLQQVAAGLTAGSAILLLIFSVVIGLVYVIVRRIRAVRLRSYPEVAAFLTTQDLTEWVTNSKLCFDRLGDRRDNIRKLERLALLFENGFGQALQCSDHSQQQPFALVAAHFRNLRSWIAFPQADTRANLRRELATTLNILASGEYHYLPRAEHPSIASHTSVARRLLNAGRTILIGALPILALLVIETTNVNLDASARTTWLIGSIVWACVTYITAMDPLSAAKFTSARDLLAVLTPRK